MFYEQAVIESFLKCASCSQKYDEPRMLPCGRTICSACLDTLVKLTDKTANSFKCSMCQGTHENREFPVNKSVKDLLKASPAEVFRCDLVEKFKANLSEIELKKAELERLLLNGADLVEEHCIEIRLDVDLATERAIEEIQRHRDSILKQINDYEAETVDLIQAGERAIRRKWFEISVKSMAEFSTD